MNKLRKKVSMGILTMLMLVASFAANIQPTKAATYTPVTLYDIPGTSATVTMGSQTAWWAEIGKIQVNGEDGFCIEPTIVGLSGQYTNVADIPAPLKNQMELIKLYGYDLTGKTDADYAATQYLIWETMGASVSLTGSFASQYPAMKADILAKISAHNTRPSFHNGNYTVNLGESLTLNDTNGVLSQFHVSVNGGANVSISGNNLTITPDINTPDNITVEIKKVPDQYLGSTLVLRSDDPNGQDVAVLKSGDPLKAAVNIKVNKYVDVTLHKEDLETGSTPQGDARLVGAEYSLYKSDGTFVETKTIGNDLTLKFEKLMASDEYYIQETKAPTGYKLNPEKISIKPLELLNNGSVGADLQYSVVSKEEVIKGDFDITKIISDGSSGVNDREQDAEFAVQLTSDIASQGIANAPVYDTLVTDANGYDKSIKIPYGTYTVTQTKQGNENLALAQSWQVEIKKENQPTINYIVTNQLHTAYLKVVKYDATTNETIVYSNATFKIWDYQTNAYYKEQVGKVTVDEWKTDEEGSFMSNREMKAGKYALEEVTAPDGYNLNSTKIDFTITASNVHEDNADGKPITLIKVSNQAPVGKIILDKTYEEFDSEKVAGFEVKNGMLPVINPATGVVIYEPFAQVLNPNSEDGLWYEENGQLLIDNLPMGTGLATYTVQEKVTGEEYQVNDKVFTFTFKKDGDTTLVYEQRDELENKLKRTDIEVVKTDLYSNEVVTGIEGFEITAYLDETCTEVYDTQAVDSVTGKAVFEDVVYGTTLYFKETATHESYYLSDEVIKVVLDKELNGIGEVYSFTYANRPVPTIGTTATGINGEKILDPTIVNELTDISDVKNIDVDKTYTIHVKFWKYDESGNGEHKVVLEDVYKNITFSEADTTFTSKLIAEANTLEEGRYFFTEHFYDNEFDNPEIDTPIVEHNDPADEDQTLHMEKTQYEIQVNKLDKLTDQAITGLPFTFEFTCYKDGKVVDTVVTDGNEKNGIATFVFKGEGTYDEIRIKEKRAPEGFVLSDEEVIVKMDDFNEDHVYSIKYYNQMMEVVQTGDTTNFDLHLSLLGLSGMLFFALGLLIHQRRKQQYAFENVTSNTSVFDTVFGSSFLNKHKQTRENNSNQGNENISPITSNQKKKKHPFYHNLLRKSE